VTGAVLVARLDNAGDVLLAGPAVRAVAAAGQRVVVLAAPQGVAAAELLPGVDRVLSWRCPWIDAQPPEATPGYVQELLAALGTERIDQALILTSFHQSPLPLALLLRLSGVARIAAISEDYPGSLLDVRHRTHDDQPEAERGLSLAAAAGFRLPAGDDGKLAVRRPLPPPPPHLPRPYVVLHPGASVPARQWPLGHFAAAVFALSEAGWPVVVSGSPGERALTAAVAGRRGIDLGGRTTLAELAGLLAGAAAVVVGNTGPAHLAAAVGTPVVSLFAPTVPAVRWAPYGVESVLLGDQDAPCAGTRATVCPVPSHPCLSSVSSTDVVAAVTKLAGDPAAAGFRAEEPR